MLTYLGNFKISNHLIWSPSIRTCLCSRSHKEVFRRLVWNMNSKAIVYQKCLISPFPLIRILFPSGRAPVGLAPGYQVTSINGLAYVLNIRHVDPVSWGGWCSTRSSATAHPAVAEAQQLSKAVKCKFEHEACMHVWMTVVWRSDICSGDQLLLRWYSSVDGQRGLRVRVMIGSLASMGSPVLKD